MTASTRWRGLNAAGPAPILQQPDAGTGLSRKEHDESTRRVDRDPCGIFRSPTDASGRWL